MRKSLIRLIALASLLFIPLAVTASNGGAQHIVFGPYLTTAGVLLPSPQVFHYAAGTTNEKDCWSDETKATPVAQPFVGDTSGMARMYCDGDYKFKIEDTDSNVLYTWDAVKVTSDTATMWEGNNGTAYPSASATNRWQLFAKHTAGNVLQEVGINDGTGFNSISGGALPSSTKSGLPTAGTAGRLWRVTDDVRGLWLDTGSRWIPIHGGVINIVEAATAGTGTTGDPWTGWDSAALLGYPVQFRDGFFATSGILANQSAGQSRIQWMGAGMVDTNTIKGTTIRGTGVGTYLIKTLGVRYVSIKDMTLDANSVKDATLVMDGPSASGGELSSLYLTGALVDTFKIAPDPSGSTQEDLLTLRNCFFVSPSPSSSQVRITSSNALLIQFHGGGFGGNVPYNVRAFSGGLSFYDVVFSGATTADIFLETQGSWVNVYNGHSESGSAAAKFLYAPVAGAYGSASYDSKGSLIINFKDSTTRTGDAITHESTRPITVINSFLGGDVRLTSPAILYEMGMRLLSGKAVIGTGSHVGIQTLQDATLGILTAVAAFNKLNIGTDVTSSQNPGDMYIHHQGAVKWTNNTNTDLGGQIAFRMIPSLADGGVSTLNLVGSGNAPAAIIQIMDDDGNGAIYMLRGGNHATVEMADSGGVFTNTAASAASTNIYWSAGNARYELENKRGAAKIYRIFYTTETN